MNELRKDLSTNPRIVTKRKSQQLDFLLLLFIYSGPVLNSILFIINAKVSSGQLANIYIVVGIGSMILAISNFQTKLSKKYIEVFISLIVILLAFYFTKWNWNTISGNFESALKLYIATIFSVMLITVISRWERKKEISLSLILNFNLMITVICSFVVINSDSYTVSGLMSDSSGFLYQNTSYYAAYCLGMTFFLLNELKNTETRAKLKQLNLYVLGFVQIIICIVAGGKGGMVLAFFLLIYYILIMNSFKKILHVLFPTIIGLSLLFLVIPTFITKFGVNTTGLTRTLSIFTDGLTDSTRSNLRQNAIMAFRNKPIFGNGIGSVYYLLGGYSHNLFTDILVEVGVFGFSVFFIVITKFIMEAKRLYRKGSLYRFLIMIFICGFILNLFSGYIWVNQFIMLPMAIIFTNSRLKTIISSNQIKN